MTPKDNKASIKNAEASIRMEGFTITADMRERCSQVITGDTTTEKSLKELFLRKPARTGKSE